MLFYLGTQILTNNTNRFVTFRRIFSCVIRSLTSIGCFSDVILRRLRWEMTEWRTGRREFAQHTQTLQNNIQITSENMTQILAGATGKAFIILGRLSSKQLLTGPKIGRSKLSFPEETSTSTFAHKHFWFILLENKRSDNAHTNRYVSFGAERMQEV